MNYTKEQVLQAVNGSRNWFQTLIALGIKSWGRETYFCLKQLVKKYSIDVSHFTKGHSTTSRIKRKVSDYLCIDGPRITSDCLKKKLLKAGLLNKQCSICSLINWLEKPIVLQLDHINGNPKDNRLENLRILCPNCHTQTPTFCRGIKNIKSSLCVCGNTKQKNSKNCSKCYFKSEKFLNRPRISKIVWPPLEELTRMLSESNFVQVGKQLGVSDNAIRKHLTKMGV